MACSALLGASLGALSNGMALLAREEETVIAPSNFVLLPLTFLSSAFMQRDLIRGWVQSVARYNPGLPQLPAVDLGPCVRGSSGGGAATPAGVGVRAPGGR
jgi:ABC-2 type transporter